MCNVFHGLARSRRVRSGFQIPRCSLSTVAVNHMIGDRCVDMSTTPRLRQPSDTDVSGNVRCGTLHSTLSGQPCGGLRGLA
jgi:hypothetical protein